MALHPAPPPLTQEKQNFRLVAETLKWRSTLSEVRPVPMVLSLAGENIFSLVAMMQLVSDAESTSYCRCRCEIVPIK